MTETPRPRVGDVLEGKYRVERILGEGGMGVVLEARHLVLDELVAVKVLLPQATKDAAAVTRFVREGRAASRLRSTHVVRVHDVGTLPSGLPFLVMERLEGQDLASLLQRKGRLAPSEAADYVLQGCEAIAEAHALGIVHRDLKPSNLFLARMADGSSSVKVLDFGISKLQESSVDGDLTGTQATMGSPLYMAPEAIRGVRQADARSDVWALGVVLYELVSATTPYTGASGLAVAAKILQEAPTPLRSVRADIDERFEAVVMRCLEREPDDRFQSVGQLVLALSPLASDHARGQTDRILRVVREAQERAKRRTDASDQVAAVEIRADANTASAWGGHRQPSTSRGTLLAIFAGAIVALASTIVAVLVLRDPSVAPAREERTRAQAASREDRDEPREPRAKVVTSAAVAAPSGSTPPPAASPSPPSPSAPGMPPIGKLAPLPPTKWSPSKSFDDPN